MESLFVETYTLVVGAAPPSEQALFDQGVVGHRLVSLIHGIKDLNVLEVGQVSNRKRKHDASTVSLSSLIRGNTITNEKEQEKLLRSQTQISLAIEQMLVLLQPKPVEKLFATEYWKSSVYCALPRDDIDVRTAFDCYRNNGNDYLIVFYIDCFIWLFFIFIVFHIDRIVLDKSTLEWLVEMANTSPKNLILRSSSTRVYMSVADSLNLIFDWLLFQYDGDEDAVNEFAKKFYNWIAKIDFKRGGFLVHGPASSGKSYLFNAFCDIYPFVGQIRPQPGYTFNFDDCPGNQLVLCEWEHQIRDQAQSPALN